MLNAIVKKLSNELAIFNCNVVKFKGEDDIENYTFSFDISRYKESKASILEELAYEFKSYLLNKDYSRVNFFIPPPTPPFKSKIFHNDKFSFRLRKQVILGIPTNLIVISFLFKAHKDMSNG